MASVIKNKLIPFKRNKNLYLTIGISGSGKSTYSKKYPDCLVLNKDSIRFMLYNFIFTNIDFFEGLEKLIQYVIRLLFLKLIRLGFNLYIDETNLLESGRAYYIENALKEGYKIHFLVFKTKAEEISQNRKRKVAKDIIEKQKQKFTMPSEWEKSIAESITIINELR